MSGLTFIPCALHSTCMRLILPVDAKCSISVMACRRSPSAMASIAVAFAASALYALPPCMCSAFCTSAWPPMTASCRACTLPEPPKWDAHPLLHLITTFRIGLL